MKTQTQTITLAKRKYGYAVYHTGVLEDGIILYRKELVRKVGTIKYDMTIDQYKFYPSIWYMMIWRVDQCKEMTEILTRLNKGERL